MVLENLAEDSEVSLGKVIVLVAQSELCLNVVTANLTQSPIAACVTAV